MGSDPSEHMGEVSSERLVRAGRLSGYVLDGICREVAVAFAESSAVLAESIGHPVRQSHADHRFPGGLKWDVHVVDLLRVATAFGDLDPIFSLADLVGIRWGDQENLIHPSKSGI